MRRTVFFLSDHTGITAETLGRSLLSQYDNITFTTISWPFLDSVEKAAEAVEQINLAARDDGCRPLMFSTLVNPAVRRKISESEGILFDFFDTFNERLENELGVQASLITGRSHGIRNYASYSARIDSLNFALANDDGVTTSNYFASEVILLGVSRSGKTPTSLYLALRYGVLAANYPLTEEDLNHNQLPESLLPYRDKLFGLTINPERLQEIRRERLPNSRYATMRQCQFEVDAVEQLYRKYNIRFVNTTAMSIEEIAATVMHQAGLKRRLYG